MSTAFINFQFNEREEGNAIARLFLQLPSFNRPSSQDFVTSNSEVVGCLFTNNLTPTNEGRDTKADGQEESTDPNLKTRGKTWGKS